MEQHQRARKGGVMKKKAQLVGLLMVMGISGAMQAGTAQASGVNLMCVEQRGTEENERSSSSPISADKSEKEIKEIGEPWKMPVFVDASGGKGSIWGKPYDLAVEPDTLYLRRKEKEEKSGDSVSRSVYMKINRKTLGFSYSNLLILNSWSRTGVSVRSVSVRKSEGVCKKVVAVSGNQI